MSKKIKVRRDNYKDRKLMSETHCENGELHGLDKGWCMKMGK